MRRTWELGPFDDGQGGLLAPSDDDLARELIGAAFSLGRWGGSLIVAPKRVRYENGSYETVGWVLKYDSGNVPAAEASRAPIEAPPAPDELTPAEVEDHFPTVPEVAPEPEPALAE